MGVIKYKIKTNDIFLKLRLEKLPLLDIFTILSLQHQRGISQNVSRLFYVWRGAGYKIHTCAKLYYLRRPELFSSTALYITSFRKYAENSFLFWMELALCNCMDLWSFGHSECTGLTLHLLQMNRSMESAILVSLFLDQS